MCLELGPMKELRCILFTNREVLSAILDRRRKVRDVLPDGQVTNIRLEKHHATRCTLEIDGGRGVIEISEIELQAALLSHCMAKHVPLPAEAEKTVHLIRGRAAMIMTLNFNKSARLICDAEDRVQPLHH
jgi:hypothetical protein